MEEILQPGYRFYPTEEELVSFYLHNKLEGKRHDLSRVIPLLDIYQLEPWHLPNLSGQLCNKDTEQWFFFAPRQQREAQGGRPNRTTATGYWKATGSPSYVYSSDNRVIGVKKTMVFYQGKAPTGRKTKWKMNEYRAIKQEVSSPLGCVVPKLRHELSLCRVYITSGSFGAFDRRPLGAETSQTTKLPQFTQTGEKTSSSESSCSQEKDFLEVAQTNFAVFNGLPPLSDCGQLNWL